MLCTVYTGGFAVTCPPLTDPNNGMITCPLRDDGVPSCSFTCNTGFKLTGSDTRNCQNDGSWSGTATFCLRGMMCHFVYVFNGELEPKYILNFNT